APTPPEPKPAAISEVAAARRKVTERPEPEPARPAAAEPQRDWWAAVERQVGQRWLVYLGGLLIVVAAGFLIKYAYDQQWITPSLIVTAGLLVGAGFVAAGDRFVRKGMRVLGLALIGAPGLPLFYVSLYAACQVYGLIPHGWAFGAMVLATAAGMALAVLHESLAISFLSVLGGLLTPLLVSTGVDARDALFTYLLILDLGVLGVAFLRRWRTLDVLAFAGTAALFAGWYAEFYAPAAMVPTLLWLGAFYLTFLILPFAWHLREGMPATVERFVMALVVAALAFGAAWAILHAEHPHALGWIALGMTACYGTLGVMARAHVPEDRRGLFGFAALAMVFATVTVPLHLKLHGIPLVWAAEAVALVGLGYRFRYLPVRVGGLVVLAVTVVRLFGWHWPLHDGEEAFTLLINPGFGTAAWVCAAGGLTAVFHELWREDGGLWDRAMKIASAVAAGLLAIVVLHGEARAWLATRAGDLGRPADYLSRTAGGAIWTLGSLAFVAASLWWACGVARKLGYAVLLVGTGYAVASYWTAFEDIGGHFANARFLVALLLAGAWLAEGWGLRRWRERCDAVDGLVGALLDGAAGLLLLVAVQIDLGDWLAETGRYEAALGSAALWAVGAAGLMAAGLWRRVQAQRVGALVALGVGAVLALRLFRRSLLPEFRLFANGRFVVALVAVAAAFGSAWALRRFERRTSAWERLAGKAVYWTAGALLLAVLSGETWLYGKTSLADAEQAGWSAQMLLSIAWSVYAVGLLVVGFWRRVRSVRLTALGLFGVTAVKLILVDLSFLEGLYRVLSFLVIGVLMIGASYLYHRIEKQLREQWAAEGEPDATA
ncbi:MAG: DUF2339 domain-containing protein, partial [bacterium]